MNEIIIAARKPIRPATYQISPSHRAEWIHENQSQTRSQQQNSIVNQVGEHRRRTLVCKTHKSLIRHVFNCKSARVRYNNYYYRRENRSTNTHKNDHLHKQLYLNLIERSTTFIAHLVSHEGYPIGCCCHSFASTYHEHAGDKPGWTKFHRRRHGAHTGQARKSVIAF